MRRSGSRRKGTSERPSMLLSALAPASSRIVGAMSMLRGQLAGLRAGLDPRPADQEGHVGGRLVGEELAAEQAVLAEEEAVVGGEDDVGVAQPAHPAEGVDDQSDAVVDGAQALELLLPVDAVGVLLVQGQVRGFADEAGLVGDVALVEAFGAVVGQRGPP